MARPETKKAEARRATLSLAIAIALPVSLTSVIILLFGSGHKYRALAKPLWFPPLWLIHLASLCSSTLMSLAAWLVWAEGGFHAQSNALPLYISQVSLSVVWDPLVLVMRAFLIGLIFCLVHFITLISCYRSFGEVNPAAKALVKPCLVWIVFLTLITFKLIFL